MRNKIELKLNLPDSRIEAFIRAACRTVLLLSSKIGSEEQMPSTRVRDGMLNLHSNPCMAHEFIAKTCNVD